MTVFNLLLGFVTPPLVAAAVRGILGLPVRSQRTLVSWTLNGAGSAACLALVGGWSIAEGNAASAVLALILWWWSRRKRRKGALKALGNKARARLAAMAGNMPKPVPVLRPVPQGSPS